MRRTALPVAICAALLAVAVPASAHVTVSSPGAAPGGYGVLTFRVPTESDTASTVKLQVQLPPATPFAEVLVEPHPGWRFTTRTVRLAKAITDDDGNRVTRAVGEVDWTATARSSAIKPGEFGEFSIEAGPLPKRSQIAFAAIQTYSDGSVVRWNQTAAPGSSVEPDHPKPTLRLVTAAAAPRPVVEKDSTTGPTVLGIAALVVAALALGFAIVGNARRRRS